MIRRAARLPLWRAMAHGLAFALCLAAPVHAGAPEPSHLTATKSIAAPAGFSGICDRYAWACARRTAQTRPMSEPELLAAAESVNRRVNRSVREISDQRQYSEAEHWALPTARGGDCEDFALLKKRELIRSGVAPDRLLIATALTRARQAHAVLILRTASGDMVLDNLSPRIRPWQDTGYLFLRMQDPAAPGRWQLLLAETAIADNATGAPRR